MSTLQYVRDTSTNKNRVLEVDSSCKLSVNDAAAQSSLSLINGKITTCDTSAIVVSSSALPSGAATSSNQSTANLSLSSIDSNITNCDTSAVIVSSCALPSGAATSSNQSTANLSLSSIDSSLSNIDSNITNCDTSAVTVSSCALPSGAASSLLQTSGNSTLSDIDSKLGGTLTTSAGVSRNSGNFAVSSSVISGDVSSSVDANSYKNIAVFGNLGGSGDIEIQVSNDNSNWYNSDKQIYSNYSSYDLYGSFQCDARYIRVKYNISGTVTLRYALMS